MLGNSIESSSKKFDCYRRLNSLKSLRMQSTQDVEILHILEALHNGQIELEELSWSGKCDKAVIDAVCRLKSITHLQLRQTITQKNLARLVENFRNLICIKVTCKTVHGILNALKKAQCLKEATFEMVSGTLNGQQNVSSILDKIDLIRCERGIQLNVLIQKVSYLFFLQMRRFSIWLATSLCFGIGLSAHATR